MHFVVMMCTLSFLSLGPCFLIRGYINLGVLSSGLSFLNTCGGFAQVSWASTQTFYTQIWTNLGLFNEVLDFLYKRLSQPILLDMGLSLLNIGRLVMDFVDQVPCFLNMKLNQAKIQESTLKRNMTNPQIKTKLYKHILLLNNKQKI